MKGLGIAAAALMVVALAGCGSSSAGGGGGPQGLGSDEVNRYVLKFSGAVSLDHSGGLICKVEDGALVMDFSIDASDGLWSYEARFPGFVPSGSSFPGTFTLNSTATGTSTGDVTVSFSYGPAPKDYPGVVKASGTISGSVGGAAGSTDLSGSYACFLQNAEVGQ